VPSWAFAGPKPGYIQQVCWFSVLRLPVGFRLCLVSVKKKLNIQHLCWFWVPSWAFAGPKPDLAAGAEDCH
jgi:hypothetical protein